MAQHEPRARLAALIAADGASYAALSRMLRRNDAYVQQYVRRGTPRLLAERDRRLLAAYFRVDEAELGAVAGTADGLAEIRRLDVEASAGPGALAGEELAASTVRLDPRLLADLRLRPETSAMLTARGDSMEPTIHDGDRIVVDERDRRVGPHPAIFVLRIDGALLVKRVARVVGDYLVTSDNPAYPPLSVDAVDIVGRVVWLSRSLR